MEAHLRPGDNRMHTNLQQIKHHQPGVTDLVEHTPSKPYHASKTDSARITKLTVTENNNSLVRTRNILDGEEQHATSTHP